jgi:predicted RNA-binding Zn ribbon-like protein
MNNRGDGFEWSGGHPALDFVNTLDERPSDEPIENLATYHDLVRFAELAGLIEPPIAKRLLRLRRGPALGRIVKGARRLREHLHDILEAKVSGRPGRQPDLDALSAAIKAAHAARTLVASRSGGLVRYRWCSPRTPEIPLHACALAIESLLVDEECTRIRKCAAADCDVYYLDTSKSQRRQWCSMNGCGNREKQRRRRAVARN